jgi:hypothetical protein
MDLGPAQLRPPMVPFTTLACKMPDSGRLGLIALMALNDSVPSYHIAFSSGTAHKFQKFRPPRLLFRAAGCPVHSTLCIFAPHGPQTGRPAPKFF